MAKPGFLNDNQFRSYPFIHGEEGGIPDCAIVDFGSTALAGSGYQEGVHRVWLEWIRRLNRTIEFSFRCDAPGLEDMALIFQRDIGDSEFATSFTWAQKALTQTQLDEGCDCEANWLCNSTFDEESPGTTTTPEPGSSSLGATEDCDKYPGSPVFGWRVDEGVDQSEGLLRFQIPPLTTLTAGQVVNAFYTGQHLKLFFDLVETHAAAVVQVGLASPDENSVLQTYLATTPGTFGLTLDMPAFVDIYTVIRITNTSATQTITVTLDNITLQACISNSSSFGVDEPPEECPADSVWEGFLVTGDIACLLEYLEDCTRTGGIPGGEGDADVMFLTDTTGSMTAYINTIRTVFSPLATAVSQALPQVRFRWAASSYKDFEDGGPYTSGIRVDRGFTTDITQVQTAINGWTASGGGDLPEQGLAALKMLADQWNSGLGGRPGAQKIIIWGGDVIGWESGAKGNPYPSLADVVAAIHNTGIKVFAINPTGPGSGLDGPGDPSNVRQATAICAAGGGVVTHNVGLGDADRIAEIVARQIITSASFPGEVIPSLLEGPAYLEPSRTKNLDGAYLRSLGVVNAARTRATAADGCRDRCVPPSEPHCVLCECIAGDVRFAEGYNSVVRVEPQANTIVLDAELGAGDGTPCTEVPACITEQVVPGFSNFSGSETCLEVVRSFNGQGGRNFEFVGGDGVTVTAVPAQHRVIIDVHLNELAAPYTPPAVDPVACFSPSEDPCDCGPADLDDFECPDNSYIYVPTSTTLPPDPACGTCTAVWIRPPDTDGAWEPAEECLGGCECILPTLPGDYHGQIRTCTCLPPADCVLENARFTSYVLDASDGLQSLANWDYLQLDEATGGHGQTLLHPTGNFAVYPSTHHGVLVRLLATASGNVVLRQTFPVTPNGIYRISAYIHNPRGNADWGVSIDPDKFDATTILPPITSSETPDSLDSGLLIEFTVGVPEDVTEVTIFFRADKFLTASGRGWLDVAHPCAELL